MHRKTQPEKHNPGSFFDARAHLEKAENLRRAGELVAAQKICETLLKQYPDYVGALHTLGLILADRGRLKQAWIALSEALSLNPKNYIVLIALSTVYVQMEAFEMASHLLQQVLEQRPDDSGAMVLLGEIYLGEKEYARAADILQKATALEGEGTLGKLSLANAYTHLGRLQEAADILNKLARQKEPTITTLYHLSQLPQDLVDVDVLDLLDTATRTVGISQEEFENISAFTKAAALNAKGKTEESWQTLTSANRKKFGKFRNVYEEDLALRRNFLARAAQSEILPRAAKYQKEHPVSLFIFGPSRSGKTSFERLIGMLDGVKRGYENPILSNAARRTFQFSGLPSRSNIVGVPPALDDLCRQQYLEEVHVRAGEARVFTNTHPGGIFDAYRLAILVPNARFIFMKRDRDDITYRIFGKLYRSGHHYSYELKTAREYIDWYFDSIDAIAKLLPNHSTVIQYEDVIADPHSALAAAAQLCGLENKHGKLLEIGDDRGCAKPYVKFF